jgi:hypothetical protein
MVPGWLGCSAQTPQPSAPTAIDASPRRSSASEREHVALTVYNSGFALVREQRRLELGTGRVALAYEDVSAQVEPQTVHLRSLDDPDALVVLEQNYRYDLLTPRTLLDKYVGHRLRLARYDERRGVDEVVDAELLANESGPVLRIDGQIVTATEGFRFLLPAVPASLLARPTLVWLLDSREDAQRTELSYLTRGLSWHADYVLVLDASGSRGDLTGWVTLDNQSGTSFSGAALALVAGDVQRVAPPPPPAPPELDMVQEEAANGAGTAFRQEALFEYHLYSLERPTDVLDREQKQVSLLEARGTALERKLTFRGNDFAFRGRAGDEPKRGLSALIMLDNSEQKGLGMPLPAGVVRVYQADSSGALQFVGEDAIEHTARDERVELELGDAFDVLGRRRQLEWRAAGSCSAESSWEIELDNHKDAAVHVEVLEPVSGEYQVLRSSHRVEPRDAQSFAFELDVPARSKTQITYQVRVRWC